MDENEFSISRRRFLGEGLTFGGLGLAASPIVQLVNMITDGVIARAQAAETGADPIRNYVNLLLPGAPSRYVFDHWLRTNADDPAVVANPMNATALTSSGGRANGTQYLTFDYQGVLVPQFFRHSVVSGSGQARPLTDLLNNMLVIRGYGTGFDGHSPNVATQLAPLGGASSISGVAADYSTRTFQALQYPARGGWGNFSSSTGKALNIVGTANPLADLMSGFKSPAGSTASLLQRQQAALDLATARLQAYARSGFAGSKTVAQNMTAAKALVKRGISDVDSFWAEALARYSRVFTDSARTMGLEGFSDMSMVADPNDTRWKIHIAEGDSRITAKGDLSTIIKNFLPSSNLIEGFVLAEYVLTHGLATSLELMIPLDDISKIVLPDGTIENTTGFDGSKTKFSLHNDMHAMGSIPCVLITSTLFRGISAVLLEFIDRLKESRLNGSDLWSQTVFQITSDFGRSGRLDGSGADHGINQMVTSLYSGVIQKPMVVGNIWSDGHNPGFDQNVYGGTQGAAAPIAGYNQSGSPTPLMMASTVAALLGAPTNPFANVASPLVSVQNGVAVAANKGKMVSG